MNATLTRTTSKRMNINLSSGWFYRAAILALAAWLLHSFAEALLAACVTAFSGVWIEKGMGLIIPGFVPSTLHEVVEYSPSLTEWKISAGIYAAGLMVLIVLLKIALPVFSGEVSVARPSLTSLPPSNEH